MYFLILQIQKGNKYKYYCSLSENPRISVFEKDWLDDTIDVPYEDGEIKIPRKYDEYLRLQYGDYMTLPPVEKRVSQHYHYYVDLEQRLSIEEVRQIKRRNVS